MASDSSVDAFIKAYHKRLEESIYKQVKAARADAWKEWIVYVKKKAEELANGVADDFYADYQPEFYERRGSLYHVLQMKIEDNGNTLSYGFDEQALTFRNGYGGEDGLYDQVFRKGWHGGAGSIDPNKASVMGEHPSPGYPYWRKPYSPPGSKKTGYYRWGRPADMSPIPPIELFDRRFDRFLTMDAHPYYNKLFLERINNIKPTVL